MAAKYDNHKGFLIIEASLTEFVNKCEFGIADGICVCDNCNEYLRKDIQKKGIFGKDNEPIYYKTVDNSKYYYIAVLNMLFCKKCCDEFIANSPKYDEDAGYELRNYERIGKLLGMFEQDSEPHDSVLKPFNP